MGEQTSLPDGAKLDFVLDRESPPGDALRVLAALLIDLVRQESAATEKKTKCQPCGSNRASRTTAGSVQARDEAAKEGDPDNEHM
jgi:hypothetical protein